MKNTQISLIKLFIIYFNKMNNQEKKDDQQNQPSQFNKNSHLKQQRYIAKTKNNSNFNPTINQNINSISHTNISGNKHK